MERLFGNENIVADLPRVLDIVQFNPYGPAPENPTLILGNNLASWIIQVGHFSPKQSKFKAIMNFLGISIPFCTNRYSKRMEFAVEKHAMGRDNDKFLEKQIKQIFKRWQKRWLVVGNNNIFYYEYPEDPAYAIRDNVLFDTDTSFQILHIGRRHVEAMFDMSRRKLKISIEGTINGIICLSYVVKAFLKSPYTKIHRFTSFAPIREGNDCIFFSDGIGYYKELYAALNKAQQDIMITDWWLSPEMPLIRPIKGDLEQEESRVDFTLKRAAERGVKVHILIYKEFTLGLNTDSEHAEKRLESLHPNIRVMRHPSVVLSLWSHHEKMVIVDRRKVFMGGLDLCWNRMDGNNHPLFNNDTTTMFPGVDYGNPLRKDIVKGREYRVSMLTSKDPRMPWHDVATMLVGKVCNDFVVHFGAYWNHAKETNYERETLEVKKHDIIPLDENREFHVRAPVQDRNLYDDSAPQNYRMQRPSQHQLGFPSLGYDNVNGIADLSISDIDSSGNIFEMMRREFDRQKRYNDALPKAQGYNTNMLEQAYSALPQRKNQNPLMRHPQNLNGITNPYQPKPGTVAYAPYGATAYHPGGAPQHQHAGNLHPMSGHQHHNHGHLHGHRNPFEILSSRRRPDGQFEEFHIFMRDNMEQDSSNWQNWLRANPEAIQSDTNQPPTILQAFAQAFQHVANQKKVVKINRFLEDRDEQSRQP